MANKILYINSAVRAESRTNELAKYLLEKLDGDITELKLEDENLKPLNGKSLAERDFIIGSNDKDNEILKYARQFAKADIIVIAAPFWDYSFPALLKTYIENISVLDTTFTYDEMGNAVGLCKAKKVYYVSTAGGRFVPDFCFNYLKRLFNDLYGISDMRLFYAENLDIDGFDTHLIMKEAKEKIDKEEFDMEEVQKFLKECGVYYLATVDGNEPKVRPFGTAEIFEGHLYIQTGKNKDVYKQIEANNNVELCGFKDGKWIRVSGKLIPDDRIEAKKDMLDKNPELRGMYDENDDNTIVLYFEHAKAVISSFTEEQKIIEF